MGQSSLEYLRSTKTKDSQGDAPMTACHNPTSQSNGQDLAAVQVLLDHLAERCASQGPLEDFLLYEQRVRTMMAAIEREVLARELARHDLNVPEVFIDGVAYRQVIRCPDKYLTRAGEISVERSLYRNQKQGSLALAPMELSAGVIEGYWSPGAAKLAAYTVAQMTPGDSADLFKRIGLMNPSKRALDRLVKGLSEEWEVERPSFEIKLRQNHVIPKLAVSCALSLDGVMVPMRDGDRAQKRRQAKVDGKQTSGPTGYREASCASISFYDKDGERLVTYRYARMPESNQTTLKAWLRAEFEHVVLTRPDIITTAVADGARGNWTFLDSLALRVPGLVDYFHAVEHLKSAFESAYRQNPSRGEEQFKKYRRFLRDNETGVEKVIRALSYLAKKHPRRKRLKKELKYFRKRRYRMGYAAQKAKHLPIGSGVIEACCKTLATQRLKCSGMRWTVKGGQAILTWRSQIQSGDFDEGFSLVAQLYKSNVECPENVIPFRPRA